MSEELILQILTWFYDQDVNRPIVVIKMDSRSTELAAPQRVWRFSSDIYNGLQQLFPESSDINLIKHFEQALEETLRRGFLSRQDNKYSLTISGKDFLEQKRGGSIETRLGEMLYIALKNDPSHVIDANQWRSTIRIDGAVIGYGALTRALNFLIDNGIAKPLAIDNPYILRLNYALPSQKLIEVFGKKRANLIRERKLPWNNIIAVISIIVSVAIAIVSWRYFSGRGK